MNEAAAVEAMLSAAANAATTREEVGNTEQPRERESSSDRRRERERSGDRRKRDRSADRGSRRDRDRSPDRSRRDRDRDRSPDRRRRDRSGDRYRRRSPGRRSTDRGNGRERSRDRSPDRGRSDRGRSPTKDSREKSPEVSREELRRQREIDDLTKDQRTIFVSQLTKKTTETNLRNFFGEIGKVKNIIMLRDKVSGVHKGFAYVEMADLESIPNCLLFNNVVPDFQKFPILVKASEAEKNFLAKKDPFSTTYEPQQTAVAGVEPAGPDTRIYVGNIHIGVDDATLRAVVESFGPVESVKLHRDNLGNSKGFAFVKYLTKDAALRAGAGLAGFDLMGRPLKIGPVVDANSHVVNAGMGAPGAPGAGGDMSGSWKLDADEGSAGMALNSSSRMALMAKLGQSAGLVVPAMPAAPPMQLAPLMPAPPVQSASIVPPVTGVPSVNLLVCNMFDPATETEPEWDQDIREDMLEEGSKFGQVELVHVETRKPGGIVLLKFATVEAAARAAHSFNGRFFAGRMITAAFVDNVTFTTLMS